MTLARFLTANATLTAIERERDAAMGWRLWKNVAVFSFLLMSPLAPLVPRFSSAGLVFLTVELAAVGFIAWFAVEYGHRRAVWFQCVCRGVVVDFCKTHEWRMWASATPMYCAYAFLFVHALVTYLGLDPSLERWRLVDVLTAALSVISILFVLLMTRNLVDLEGANAILTINMLLFLFDDKDMLAAQGFSVVRFDDLAQYILFDRKSGGAFSWDEIHALKDRATAPRRRREVCKLADGVRIAIFLNYYKDLKS